MLLNMKNIKKRKVQVNGDRYHWNVLAITATVIQIYPIKKGSIKKMVVDTNRRNQVKNQKLNQEIYLAVRVTLIATIRKEIEVEGAPIVAIGLERQKSLRNTKEEIRNENDERIKYQNPTNLLIEENPENTDLDHLVDDNAYI